MQQLWVVRSLGVFLLFSLLGLPLSAQAAEQPVRIGVGQALQPFTLPDSNSGLLVEIVRAAFAVSGVKTRFLFLPNARIPLEFKAKRIDISTMSKFDPTAEVSFTHWPVLNFINMAISLKTRQLSINSIQDLAKYRIVAFQGAHLFLGPEFAAMAERNKSYFELSRMPSKMLLLGYTDVMVSQADIFRFNLTNDATAGSEPVFNEIEYHPVFQGANQYWFAFHSPGLRDQFEAGIAALYASGEINTIFARFEKRYGTSRELFVSLDCRFLKVKKPAVCAHEQSAPTLR